MARRIFGMITTAASGEYTPYALETFFTHTPLTSTDQFFLLDNDGDSDPSLSKEHPVKLIRNRSPLGFAENMNLILREAYKCRADAVLLNNDLIFSDSWLGSASQPESTISSPLSSRELQYHAGSLSCTNPMSLDQYVGREHLLAEVVSQHRTRMVGEMNVLVLPFFAVTIPAEVISEIGLLDESFGKGGGEDYDYCLRAILSGFTAHYLLNNYIIHFGGRSSWASDKLPDDQIARNAQFFSRFNEKWGASLTDIILRENHSIILEDVSYSSLAERGALKILVETLLLKESKSPPPRFIPIEPL